MGTVLAKDSNLIGSQQPHEVVNKLSATSALLWPQKAAPSTRTPPFSVHIHIIAFKS